MVYVNRSSVNAGRSVQQQQQSVLTATDVALLLLGKNGLYVLSCRLPVTVIVLVRNTERIVDSKPAEGPPRTPRSGGGGLTYAQGPHVR